LFIPTAIFKNMIKGFNESEIILRTGGNIQRRSTRSIPIVTNNIKIIDKFSEELGTDVQVILKVCLRNLRGCNIDIPDGIYEVRP
jgi:hypothetical protein